MGRKRVDLEVEGSLAKGRDMEKEERAMALMKGGDWNWIGVHNFRCGFLDGFDNAVRSSLYSLTIHY